MSVYDEYLKSKSSEIGTVAKPIITGSSVYERYLQSKEPKPSLGQKFIETLPGTAQTLAELQVDPLSLKVDPKKALSDAWDSLKGSVTNFSDKISELIEPLSRLDRPQPGLTSQTFGKTLETVGAGAGALFSPITALFAGAKQLPVLGSVARLFDFALGTLGEGSSEIIGKIVDELPISQQMKDRIKPGFQEISALIAQLGGLKVAHVVGKKAALVKKYGAKDAEAIINKVTELAKEKTPLKIAEKGKLDFEESKVALEKRTGQNLIETTAKIEELKPIEPPERLDRIRVEAAKKEIQVGNKPPLIVEEGKVIDGNHRLQAYKELGIKDISILRPKSIPKELESFSQEIKRYPNLESALPNAIKNSDIKDVQVFGSSVKGGEYKDIDVAVFLNEKDISFKKIDKVYNKKVGNIEYHIFPDNELGRGLFDAMLDMKKETGKGFSKQIKSLSDFYNQSTNIVKEVPISTQVTRPEIVTTKSIIQPIKGTGEIKTRGLSRGVEAKAIENKLTQDFGDLPQYKGVNMKEQANKAIELLAKDSEKAKRIAMGEEAPPEGLLPESVFVAVEEWAIKNQDVNTLRDLATMSKLSEEATTMGQRIRTLGERDSESPVQAMTDIIKARKEAVSQKIKDLPKNKKIESAKIKNEIDKLNKNLKGTTISEIPSIVDKTKAISDLSQGLKERIKTFFRPSRSLQSRAFGLTGNKDTTVPLFNKIFTDWVKNGVNTIIEPYAGAFTLATHSLENAIKAGLKEYRGNVFDKEKFLIIKTIQNGGLEMVKTATKNAAKKLSDEIISLGQSKPEVKKLLDEFIIKNPDELIGSDAWKNFINKKPIGSQVTIKGAFSKEYEGWRSVFQGAFNKLFNADTTTLDGAAQRVLINKIGIQAGKGQSLLRNTGFVSIEDIVFGKYGQLAGFDDINSVFELAKKQGTKMDIQSIDGAKFTDIVTKETDPMKTGYYFDPPYIGTALDTYKTATSLEGKTELDKFTSGQKFINAHKSVFNETQKGARIALTNDVNEAYLLGMEKNVPNASLFAYKEGNTPTSLVVDATTKGIVDTFLTEDPKIQLRQRVVKITETWADFINSLKC